MGWDTDSFDQKTVTIKSGMTQYRDTVHSTGSTVGSPVAGRHWDGCNGVIVKLVPSRILAAQGEKLPSVKSGSDTRRGSLIFRAPGSW